MALDVAATTAAIGGADDLHDRGVTFVRELAAVIRSASNDQNVQRLARDLAAAAPHLADALTGSDNSLGQRAGDGDRPVVA